jgi:hypothetical protein
MPITKKYVHNPETGRSILVGGAVWKRLVKDRRILGEEDQNPESEVVTTGNVDEVTRNDLNDSLPDGVMIARGRGKYAGKMVKRRKAINPGDITVIAANAAAKAFTNNIDELIDQADKSDDLDELQAVLQNIIMTEMIKPIKSNKAIIKRAKKKVEFELEEEESEASATSGCSEQIMESDSEDSE